jgi:hypothetical protein
MKIISLFEEKHEMLIYRKNPQKQNGFDLDTETLPEAYRKPYKVYRGTEFFETPIPHLTEKISISEKPLDYVDSTSKRKPSLAITLPRKAEFGGRYLTGIYLDETNPDFGFGDIPKSNDLLLFRFYNDDFNKECVEIVYCPNKLKFSYHYLKEFVKFYGSQAA